MTPPKEHSLNLRLATPTKRNVARSLARRTLSYRMVYCMLRTGCFYFTFFISLPRGLTTVKAAVYCMVRTGRFLQIS